MPPPPPSPKHPAASVTLTEKSPALLAVKKTDVPKSSEPAGKTGTRPPLGSETLNVYGGVPPETVALSNAEIHREFTGLTPTARLGAARQVARQPLASGIFTLYAPSFFAGKVTEKVPGGFSIWDETVTAIPSGSVTLNEYGAVPPLTIADEIIGSWQPRMDTHTERSSHPSC